MSKDVSFQSALITGATSGIGEALARILAAKGINLILTGRNQAKLESLHAELAPLVQVKTITADLEGEDRKKVIEAIQSLAPDLIINNAGWGYYGDALTYTTEISLKMLRLNSEALLEIALEGARAMITYGKKGVIMNIASAGAFPVCPAFAVYSATKAFDVQFTEAFDEEVKPYGIRVLAACPGMVSTEFRKRSGGNPPTKKESKHYMSSQFAAEEIWKQIKTKKRIHVFNFSYRIMIFLVKYLLPKKLIAKIFKKSIMQRTPHREIIKTSHG